MNSVSEDEIEEPEGFFISSYPAEDTDLAMARGGRVVKLGDTAVFLCPEGVGLADLEEGSWRLISDRRPERLWFDGETVFFRESDGIYALSLGGELTRISEDMTLAMGVDGRRVYYIKQADLASDVPRGELRAMERDGRGNVMILPEEVRGSFRVKGGWIYYGTVGGMLTRAMLYGSDSFELAGGYAELELVSDKYVYYSDGSSRMLKRMDPKTGVTVSLGAPAGVFRVYDGVYVVSRAERERGLDLWYSLSELGSGESEIRPILVFENLGDDVPLYYCGGFVYLRRADGRGICRINSLDSEQAKNDILPGDAVFTGGRAYYFDGGALHVFDCETGNERELLRQ